MLERIPIRAPQEGVATAREVALETLGAIVLASLAEARQSGRLVMSEPKTIYGYPWSAQPLNEVPYANKVNYKNFGDGVGLDV